MKVRLFSSRKNLNLLTMQSSASESPFTKKILGMRIWRCKHTFNFNVGINHLGEPNELFAMHILADIFVQTAFEVLLAVHNEEQR